MITESLHGVGDHMVVVVEGVVVEVVEVVEEEGVAVDGVPWVEKVGREAMAVVVVVVVREVKQGSLVSAS